MEIVLASLVTGLTSILLVWINKQRPEKKDPLREEAELLMFIQDGLLKSNQQSSPVWSNEWQTLLNKLQNRRGMG